MASLEQLDVRLEGIAKSASTITFEKPLKVAAVLLSAATKESFDRGVDPEGTPWLPLKNPSRRRGGSSAKPLRDTGLLMGSHAGGFGSVVRLTGFSLVWGTNVDYAPYHQFGTSTIPARPFQGITDELARKITRVIEDHMAAGVRLGG